MLRPDRLDSRDTSGAYGNGFRRESVGNYGVASEKRNNKGIWIAIIIALAAALVAVSFLFAFVFTEYTQTDETLQNAENALIDAKDSYDGATESLNAATEALETARKLYVAAELAFGNAEVALSDAEKTYALAGVKLDEATEKYAAATTLAESAESAAEKAAAAYSDASKTLSSARAVYESSATSLSDATVAYRKAQAVYEKLSEGEGGSEDIETDLTATEVYNKVINSILEIRAYGVDGTYTHLGTGFIISEDGRVCTNYHVISGGFELRAYYGEGDDDYYKVTSVLGYDADIDLAIIQLEKGTYPYLRISNDKPQVGDTVYAVGSNSGFFRTFSASVVAFVDKEIESFDAVKYLQYFGLTHSGNSGCPILNAKGEVVAVNQLGDTATGDHGFGIPSEYILQIATDKNETPAEATYNGAKVIDAEKLTYLKDEFKHTVTITGFVKAESAYDLITDSVVAFPSEIDGYPVTEISINISSTDAYQYYYYYYVNHVVIPEGVKTLGGNTFYYAPSTLMTVKLPSTLTFIGENVFDSCLGIYRFFMEGGGNATVYLKDEVLYGVDSLGQTALLRYPFCKSDFAAPDDEEDVDGEFATEIFDVPSDVSIICDFACFYSEFTAINFPGRTGSVKLSVGSLAFTFNENLTEITFPEGTTNVNARAFGGNTALKKVTFPNGITSIGEIYDSETLSYYGAFDGCSALETVIFNGSVESIGDRAFYGAAIKSIILPAGVSEIGKAPFSYCTWLESADLQNTAITEITVKAFYGDSKLKTLTLPAAASKIGDYAIGGCSALGAITLPTTLEEIGAYAFTNCSALTSITLPASLTELSSYAFSGCDKLVSVTIPSGIKFIREGLFYDCEKLEAVSLPATTLKIEDGVFWKCPALNMITVKSEFAPYVTEDLFPDDGDMENTVTVYYPNSAATESSYLNDSCWRMFNGYEHVVLTKIPF